MAAGDSSLSVRQRLIAFLEDLDLDIDLGLNGAAPLTASGRFDSLALLRLALWVEQEVGSAVDPAECDFMEEWRTVDSVVQFVARQRTDNDRRRDG